MSQPTQSYKRSFSGSIGSGMKSIIGGDDRRFYVLEHRVSSKYHKAGESQRIIVDQIEIGRDSKCQVRFDESYQTVSRRHAAIQKDGDNWKLIQLSQTNSTYLNGHRIDKEWYLQSGDEIQLSTNGPKLGFIVPQGDKGLVKSIGLTARMNLFRQQALKPYKTAISALACILLVALLGGGWALYEQNDIIADYHKKAVQNKMETDSILQAKSQEMSEQSEMIAALKDKAVQLEKENQQMKLTIEKGGINEAAINKCLPGVYFVVTAYYDVTMPDGTSQQYECGKNKIPMMTGSGFLLNNGTFVTARHVVRPWDFWEGDNSEEDKAMITFNVMVNQGAKVNLVLKAISSEGNVLTLNSGDFRIDNSHDQYGKTQDGYKLSKALIDETDFAYCHTSSSSSGLAFDAEKSNNMKIGEKLTVLGFPLGLGVSADKVSPIYGSAVVAANGLQEGIILTTDSNYEHGNSGGPVFCTSKSGKLVVVGIVSAGAGRNIGCIVPISQIK